MKLQNINVEKCFHNKGNNIERRVNITFFVLGVKPTLLNQPKPHPLTVGPYPYP